MGWGPDPIWTSASLESIVDACPSQKSVLVTVKVPRETYTQYTVPGQYVQVRPSNDNDGTTKPSFLAIASGVPTAAAAAAEGGDENNDSDSSNRSAGGACTFEFLIKRTDSIAWLTAMQAGAALDVSQVLGSGYRISEQVDGFKYDFPTQNVILCGAGSGIAPLAAVIESSGVLQLPSRSCRLYYGEQTADDLCFVDRFAKWESWGVEVVPVLSQEPDGDSSSTDGSSWQGRTGYVQTALEEDGIPVPRNSAALVCGMKGMTEAVKELCTSAGMFEGRVLFNF
jgi:NAD(P)H-flavin reductase